jgi:hypothetical protein
MLYMQSSSNRVATMTICQCRSQRGEGRGGKCRLSSRMKLLTTHTNKQETRYIAKARVVGSLQIWGSREARYINVAVNGKAMFNRIDV